MEEVKPIGLAMSINEVRSSGNFLTKAVLELLSSYPGLNGREILFETLDEESGIAFYADNGALIISETPSVTGHIVQKCYFPFILVYRSTATTEYQKIKIQAFFDSIGRWISKEPAVVDGEQVRLTSYPPLGDGKWITKVVRENSCGLDPQENGVQDWTMRVTVEYTNEYDEEW